MGKASRRRRSLASEPEPEPGASSWPDWTSYIDSSKAMTKREMLRQVLSKMPEDHPEHEYVTARLDTASKEYASEIMDDVQSDDGANPTEITIQAMIEQGYLEPALVKKLRPHLKAIVGEIKNDGDVISFKNAKTIKRTAKFFTCEDGQQLKDAFERFYDDNSDQVILDKSENVRSVKDVFDLFYDTARSTPGDKSKKVQTAKETLRKNMRESPGNPTMDRIASAIIDPENATSEMSAFTKELTDEIKQQLKPNDRLEIVQQLLPAEQKRPSRDAQGVQVVRSKRTIIQEAREGSNASGFRNALSKAIKQICAPDGLPREGRTATILDLKLGIDGTMSIDATSARDIQNVSSTEDLVSRVHEVVNERDASRAESAVRLIQTMFRLRVHRLAYRWIRWERAALKIQSVHRGRRARRLFWFKLDRVRALEMQNMSDSIRAYILRIQKLLSDVHPRCEWKNSFKLMIKLTLSCGRVLNHRKTGHVSNEKDPEPIAEQQKRLNDPNAMLEWVTKNEYISVSLFQKFFGRGHAENCIGLELLVMMFCGTKLIDGDDDPIFMMDKRRKNFRIEFEERKRTFCDLIALPEDGFPANVAKVTSRRLHSAQMLFMCSFLNIEARVGQYLTSNLDIWKYAEGRIHSHLMHMRNGPPKVGESHTPKVGDWVEWMDFIESKENEVLLSGVLKQIGTKSGPDCAVISDPLMCLDWSKPHEKRYYFPLKIECPPSTYPGKQTLKITTTWFHWLRKCVPKNSCSKTFERKKSLPKTMSSATGKHVLGDRLGVLLAVKVRARGRIVDIRFNEQGEHLCSTLEIVSCANRSYIGKRVPIAAVLVHSVYTNWKQEWMRVISFARLVGRLARSLRRWHERIRARRAKELAKLARETAPRRCKDCGEHKQRVCFSNSQWTKAEGKRTCTACQDAATAEIERKRAEDERNELEKKRNVECMICLNDEVSLDDRAAFDCQHWICKECASEMYLRNDLNKCPYCRKPILHPQKYVVV